MLFSWIASVLEYSSNLPAELPFCIYVYIQYSFCNPTSPDTVMMFSFPLGLCYIIFKCVRLW